MHRNVHKRAILSKVLFAAVLGAFFFVHMQPAFIYCAYDKDFPQNVSVSSAAGQHHTAVISSASTPKNLQDNLKLNKRYQLELAFAILPVRTGMPECFTVRINRWHVQATAVFTNPLHTKPLRGPPFIWS